MKLVSTVLVAALVAIAGCAAPAPAPPAATSAAPPAAAGATTAPTAAASAKFGPKFQVLLDEAKKSDGHLRAGMDAYSPEFIRAMEDQFNQEFGIKVTLENEPGHGSREIPPK